MEKKKRSYNGYFRHKRKENKANDIGKSVIGDWYYSFNYDHSHSGRIWICEMMSKSM